MGHGSLCKDEGLQRRLEGNMAVEWNYCLGHALFLVPFQVLAP